MNQTSPPKQDTCRRCGAPVLSFTIDTQSWPVLLEDHELPITADLAALTGQGLAWRYLGPRIGWDPLIVAVRDWRPLRALHQCATTTENKPKEKNA